MTRPHTTKASIVIMGPAGCGKTTVGKRLAAKWSRPFEDADDHHSAANIEKMRAGVGLSDEDRAPWLARLNELLRERPGLVLACSALKSSYRNALSRAVEVVFVFLDVPDDELMERLRERQGHYAGDALFEGQMATLERPADHESAHFTVDGGGPTDEVFGRVLKTLEGELSGKAP